MVILGTPGSPQRHVAAIGIDDGEVGLNGDLGDWHEVRLGELNPLTVGDGDLDAPGAKRCLFDRGMRLDKGFGRRFKPSAIRLRHGAAFPAVRCAAA